MEKDYKKEIISLIEKDIINQRKYNYYKNESLVNTKVTYRSTRRRRKSTIWK